MITVVLVLFALAWLPLSATVLFVAAVGLLWLVDMLIGAPLTRGEADLRPADRPEPPS